MSRQVVLGSIALFALFSCGKDPGEEQPNPPLPVVTRRIESAPFRPVLRLPGVVRAGEVAVAAPVRGRIRYPARFASGLRDGAAVRAGEPLAILANEEVEHALTMARMLSVAADSERERWQRAFTGGVASGEQATRYREAAAVAHQELQLALQQAARLVLHAPISGRLAVAKSLPAGSEVEPGAPIAGIVAAGAARVEAWAAAGDYALLVPGLHVRVMAAAGGQQLAVGMVRELAPALDAAGILRVAAEVEDGRELPPAGEGVELEVSLGEHPTALAVPRAALVMGEGEVAVFIAVLQRGGLEARRQSVHIGLSAGDRVEVLDGLHPGDRVVVEGAAFLSDGAAIVEVPAADDKSRTGEGR